MSGSSDRFDFPSEDSHHPEYEDQPTLPGELSHHRPHEPGAPIHEVGDRVGGITIHGLLGRGAMGQAYLGSHPVLRIPVVVKRFVVERADPFAEAYLAARVESPNIVSVLDAGADDLGPYVVQRYVDGLDVRELSRRLKSAGRTLPAPRIAELLRQLSFGLHELHQAGVVHRDIKPENLFLNGEGESLVGDFGLAFDPASEEKHKLLGTPAFIAPEAWGGAKADPRVDIYALGVTAHLLATGKLPFQGSAAQLMAAHVVHEYDLPKTDDPPLAYLYALVGRCLAKDPDKRPSTMLELRRALEPIAASRLRWESIAPGHARVGRIEVRIRVGDLTTEKAPAIVNSAYPGLRLDRGLGASLAEKAGPELARAAAAHAPKKLGEVVWTAAGDLPADFVAHAIAAQDGAICLQRCSLRILLEAEARGIDRVVFPTLGAGRGGVPQALAAKLILEAIGTYAELGKCALSKVEIVLHDAQHLPAWVQVLRGM